MSNNKLITYALATAVLTAAALAIYKRYKMRYFTIEELTHSETANSLGIVNEPGEKEKSNLRRLVVDVLDPLREAYGGPLHVNSGYRCKALNDKMPGSSATSQHMKGEAADIDTRKGKEENIKVAQLAIDMGLPYDQLIIEYGGAWIHISHRAVNNRHQILYT